MPRDYKHRVTRRRKRPPVSPWLGMAAGLLIGVFAAAIAYFKLIAPPPPHIAAPAFMPETPEPPTQPAPTKEVKQEEKAPVPSPAKQRFDFYKILPEMEVVIPEEEISAKSAPEVFKPVDKPATAAPASTREPQPVTKSATGAPPSQPIVKPAVPSKGNFFLQSGSFRAADQAERLKTQVALLGLGASVQKITTNRNTVHSVRVGPFPDYNSLDKARALLKQHGIQSTAVMIR
jgi:cell division protein FtsN